MRLQQSAGLANHANDVAQFDQQREVVADLNGYSKRGNFVGLGEPQPVWDYVVGQRLLAQMR